MGTCLTLSRSPARATSRSVAPGSKPPEPARRAPALASREAWRSFGPRVTRTRANSGPSPPECQSQKVPGIEGIQGIPGQKAPSSGQRSRARNNAETTEAGVDGIQSGGVDERGVDVVREHEHRRDQLDQVERRSGH